MHRPISCRSLGRSCSLLLASVVALPLLAADTDDASDLAKRMNRVPSLSPAEALEAFQVADGFHLELVASEPQVVDPIAAAFDEFGRMYVVEMRGYPFQKEVGSPPVGRIRRLEDTDGDGTFETSVVFADGLSWPTGLALWKGGLFVCAAPDILYLQDTDGDGKADQQKTIYTGFGTRNVQALLNNLKWGIDHSIYGATAANAGTVTVDGKEVVVRGSDFRFQPATGEFATAAGTAQFGHSFDDHYQRFVCSNSNHAIHIVLKAEYLGRNPYLPVPSATRTIAVGGPEAEVFRISKPEGWRIVRTERRIASGRYKAANLVKHSVFTSATGITVYRGDAYPEGYGGNLYVGDVQGNLVHRKTLRPEGVSFVAERADEGREIVASTDNWFRPVNFVNAPDGTLYILDMYRETIEHPWSIPEDIKAVLDLEAGNDRGRVWRLAPDGFDPSAPPKLGDLSTVELVGQLESPNGWVRETAHRLIFERQDEAAVEPLQQLVRQSDSALARLHALWSLQGLDALTSADIAEGLEDADFAVREQALRLAEPRAADSGQLAELLLGMADDESPRVRYQLAYTLGEVTQPAAADALAELARQDAGDTYARTAILSSATEHAPRMLAKLLADDEFSAGSVGRSLVGQLAQVVGARNAEAEVDVVLGVVAADPADSDRLLQGLLDGATSSGKPLAVGKHAALVGDRMAAASETLTDEDASPSAKLQAIGLLRHAAFAQAAGPLAEGLSPRQAGSVQLAALRALGSFDSAEVPELVMEGWDVYTPSFRQEAIETLLGRASWTIALLEAVGEGEVPLNLIPTARQELLAKHKNATIREMVADLRSREPTASADRASVITEYQPALSLESNLERGKKVFEKNCQTCHKVGNEGFEVGPNLATVKGRSPDNLLVHILDPNREVLPNFVQYLVQLEDGRVVSGMIVSENVTSLTLQRAKGVQETVLRTEIEAITDTRKSLMPEGMEKDIDAQQMADLLLFLGSLQAESAGS